MDWQLRCGQSLPPRPLLEFRIPAAKTLQCLPGQLRSLSETAMHRMKCCFGNKLKNRELRNQRTEVRLRSKILNHFTHLGLPQFEWG